MMPELRRKPARITPMMEQYIEIKTANPDCLLFYRMGDFYELFFEDAEVASRALGIVLTKRGKHLGRDIPMCGVPIERADEYLHRLIALGHRVAVCEQLEDPAEARKRGAKSVVRRDVVRLVTPGTLTEDSLLDARAQQLPAGAGARTRRRAAKTSFALAWIDISTGEFRVRECERTALAAEIARIEPGEIIVSDALYADAERAPYLRTLPAVTPLPRDVFDGATAERRLAAFFGVATTAAFGTFSRLQATAAAAAITYVERTQLGKRPPLSPPVAERAGATLAIDQATRSNLELLRTLTGERRARCSPPSTAPSPPPARGCWRNVWPRRSPIRRRSAIGSTRSRSSSTIARCATTCASGSNPRPILRARCRASPSAAAARATLPRSATAFLPRRGSPNGSRRRRMSRATSATRSRRCAAPIPRLPAELRRRSPRNCRRSRRDGGFVRAGYEPALDEARALRDESRRVIAALQIQYAETTGVRTLKIRHNNVLGYFVDVTAQHGEKLMAAPLNATFIHRQTLAGQVRFTTAELGELEAKIANAADRALALELEIFDRLTAAVTAASGAIKAAADALAMIDVVAALAALAAERDYVRPEVDDSLAFAIGGGRHPVVEQALTGERRTVHRQRLRSFTAGRGKSRPHLAGHRAEHGGQIDVPAPERADRRARADGKFRAGARRAYRRRSTDCFHASAPPTIWRAAAPPSWSKWWKPPRSSIRPASARWSSWTKSAAARRPSTVSPSPGRPSSICTRTTAAARCSPLISTR